MTSPKIKKYANAQAVAQAFAADLYDFVQQANKAVHVALSGGSTPALLFDILAENYAEKMAWDKIHFWWGDERCVAPTDEQSNYKMTVDHLLGKIEMPEENIHRVMGEWSPEEANKAYIDEISKFLPSHNGWPVFDLIILGMGNDGHTASIFPHEIHLLNDPNICAVAIHPESGQKRVSLTGKVINNAKAISFLVTGKSKTDRVSEIFNKLEGFDKLPSSYIQPVNGQLTFYFDYDAASGIK
ncbi:6-phosphogluconolactonase [Mangrovibacterium lignilyticum]|uniref:6-phosphogluconolactonase n=1 Tax=Mangrovibacterium lignilyticum TaxID=2668052 RepID=UPI0013D4E7D2|nr:6-phosphogluconolactonase [Mangrovibacterium lignilyticum]